MNDSQYMHAELNAKDNIKHKCFYVFLIKYYIFYVYIRNACIQNKTQKII